MRSKYEFAAEECRIFGQLAAAGYRPSTIYDVGASNSWWSRLVAGVFPDAAFHLFDPLSMTFPDYVGHMTAALAAHPNFTLHEIALGDTRGMVTLGMMPDGYGSSLHLVDGVGMQERLVPLWRLDDYCRDRRLPPPALIKMDVQGSEDMVLRGAGSLLDTVDVLHIETWLTREYGPKTPLLHELIDYLAPRFVLTDLADCYYGDRHALASVDAVFMAPRFLDWLKEPTKNWSW